MTMAFISATASYGQFVTLLKVLACVCMHTKRYQSDSHRPEWLAEEESFYLSRIRYITPLEQIDLKTLLKGLTVSLVVLWLELSDE